MNNMCRGHINDDGENNKQSLFTSTKLKLCSILMIDAYSSA